MSNVAKSVKTNKSPAASKPGNQHVLSVLVKFVWVVTVLVWPVLKWALSLMTTFQFARMIYYWNTPGVFAGWSFLAYFAALTAITYFVSGYQPKDSE